MTAWHVQHGAKTNGLMPDAAFRCLLHAVPWCWHLPTPVSPLQYGTADDDAQSVLRAVDVAQLLADASEVDDTARQQGMTE